MSITLDKITIKNAKNKNESIDVSGWTKPFVVYMLAYAFDVRMQRCTAGIDKELPAAKKNAKKLEARLEMEKAQKEGKLPEHGGGGGPRQSPEDKGWIAYFTKEGHQENSKNVIGETLDRAKEWYIRRALFGYYKPGTPERKTLEADTAKFVAEYGEAILETAEKDMAKGHVGDLIRIEREAIAAKNVAETGPVPAGLTLPPFNP